MGLMEVIKVSWSPKGEPFLDETPELPLSVSVMWGHGEETIHSPEREFSPETDHSGTMASDFQSSEWWQNKSLI